MCRRSADLVAIAALTALAGAAQLLGAAPALRAALAVPLVCFLTGYAVLAAALPNTPLGGAERSLLSIGVSMAVGILGGLLLNALPGGVTGSAWLGLVSFTTLGASGIAALRRRAGARGGRQLPALSVSALQALSMCAALAITIGAVISAGQPAPPRGVDGYTLLWLVPTSGDPRSDAFSLGIQSDELGPVDYRVQLFAGDELVGEWASVRLAADQRWEVRYTLIPAQRGVHSVRALLFRRDAPPWPPYRAVEIRRQR